MAFKYVWYLAACVMHARLNLIHTTSSALSSVHLTHLDVLQSVPHVVHPHVIPNDRRVEAVVRREQLRPAEPFPPHPGRASLQAQDLARQAAPAVRAEPVLALAAGPRLLLVRRGRLVYGVDVERVAEVRVRVAGLRVGDGLVGRREVRGLEVRAGRVREGGRRAVEVLADRGQVRQPGVPIAAAVVSFLVEGRDRVREGEL